MKYTLSALSLLVASLVAYGLLFSPTFGQGISNLITQEPDLPLVAGRSFAQAQAVVDRHRANLEKVPGVYFVTPGNKVLIPGQAKKSGIFVGVRIHTNAQGEKPTTFPPEIQAIPTEIEGLPVFIEPVYILPPPPGVTILKPGGGREQAESCPAEYEETESRGWRFCVHRVYPEPIPAIMAPPIAGIPYETAMKIMERHKRELMALPGVGAVGMSANGIYIEADDPTVLPAHVEGVPLDVRPRPKQRIVTNAHTVGSQVRPVRGGTFAAANYRITLTGIEFGCETRERGWRTQGENETFPPTAVDGVVVTRAMSYRVARTSDIDPIICMAHHWPTSHGYLSCSSFGRESGLPC